MKKLLKSFTNQRKRDSMERIHPGDTHGLRTSIFISFFNFRLGRGVYTAALGQKKKKMLCCPLPTDRKMRKNRVGFFFFFFFFVVEMSDLGEEFAKICIQWLKKALA